MAEILKKKLKTHYQEQEAVRRKEEEVRTSLYCTTACNSDV